MFNKSESIANVSKSLVAAQSAMTNAVKDSANPFFKSKFADLNSVREACTPALNANKIAVLQPIVQVEGAEYVMTTLLHESGEWLSSMTKIVCAKQNDPQAYGSAISYARRYGLQALVSIGAVDDDAEAAVSRQAPQAPVKPTFTASTVAKPASGGFTAKKTTPAPVAEVKKEMF